MAFYIYFNHHVLLTGFSTFTNEKWAYFEKNTDFTGLRSFYRSFHFPHDLEESFTLYGPCHVLPLAEILSRDSTDLFILQNITLQLHFSTML